MHDKLIEILSSAKDWMTASEIADIGGWRSPGNVSIGLKSLGDRAVSRKSPKRKMGNGMPAVEWRHADKSFDDEMPVEAVKALEKNGTAMPEKSAVKESLTTQMPTDKECCNAAKVMATTAGAEVAALNARIASMQEELDDRKEVIDAMNDDIRRQVQRAEAAERNRDDIKEALVQANRANENWNLMASEFECKSIPELRVFINAAISRIEVAKKNSKKNKPAQPRRPFSVTGLTGYHAGNEKVTLFLDRRLSARSITLPAEKLNQLADMARQS